MENNLPPVYGNPPPVMTPPPPSRPQRRGGSGWMILSIVLAVVVFALLLGNFMTLFRGVSKTGPQSGRTLEEVLVEDNQSGNKLAVIDVHGMITSQSWDRSGRNMVNLIEDQFEMAGRDDSVKAVLLKVNSPGGEVLASDDIAKTIQDFQQQHGKPVITAMEGLAASGGYYVSAPCEWIVANDLTLTGSIGVIMHSVNYRGLMDKVGLMPVTFKSGRFKDMLSGSKNPEDLDPAEKQMIQDIVDQTFGKFKSVVQEGRSEAFKRNKGAGRALVQDWQEYADGRILTGKQAFDYGFVDELGNFDTAVTRAKKLAGISTANLIRYQEPFHFGNLFSLFGQSDAKTIKIDVGMDGPKLHAGQLYYLSPTILY